MGKGASADADRAVVNGAGQAVSALRASVPSAALTPSERETLRAWRDCEVGYGFGFDAAARGCDTPRRNIRRIVRALARKGMLEYARSLYWEDEPKMGAGYTLTSAGSDELGRFLCAACGAFEATAELSGEPVCQHCVEAHERHEAWRAAQGTEAGTAETEGLGPKDDGPVGEADAPTQLLWGDN